MRLREIGDCDVLDVSRDGPPYRSALVVGTLDGRPIGDITLWLDSSQTVEGHSLHERLSQLVHDGTRDRNLERPDLTVASETVSVIVNTCGNPPAALSAVASALACVPAPNEVIVVENRPGGSSVQDALRQRFCDPRVRYVEEHRPGLSLARNAGLRAATGEIVAFTDDDVLVDVNWVGSIVAAFRSEPSAGCVTGLILPSDLETQAQVRIEQFAGFSKGYDRRVYRASAPTSILFPFAAGEFGSGASTALRANVARKLGGFDPALGTGTAARGGEDLDMFVRVLLSGYALVYEPAAIIRHDHPGRTQDVWRRAGRYGIGLSAMLTKYILSGHAWTLLVRLPAAFRFITDPKSRKNAGKPEDFPAALEWIERLGMLVGPIAYLVSKRAANDCGRPASAATPVYLPTWVGEIELSGAAGDLIVPPQVDGRRYERAHLLVRAAGDPLGFVDVPISGAQIARGAIADALERVGLPGQGLVSAQERPAESAGSGTNEEPAFSVVICTRDRPDSLEQALRSVLAVDYAEYEVVVVDNAPAGDGTRALIEQLHDRRLRYVVEPVPGLSRARNRGVAAAQHEIIAFTDDDVIVDAQWLRGIARGFGRSDHVACVTGLATAYELETVSQAYFETRVKWSDQLVPRLFDGGEHRGHARFFPYAAGEIGAGVNFAVLRSALSSIGPFDEALGAGTPSQGGEDLDFFARTVLHGFTIAFEPGAIVWHRHRNEPEALRRQMIGYGSGLSAYAFKHLVRPRTWAVLATALRNATPRAAEPSLRPVATSAPGVRWNELRGLAVGPVAYLKGVRRARKLRSAVGERVGAESSGVA